MYLPPCDVSGSDSAERSDSSLPGGLRAPEEVRWCSFGAHLSHYRTVLGVNWTLFLSAVVFLELSLYQRCVKLVMLCSRYSYSLLISYNGVCKYDWMYFSVYPRIVRSAREHKIPPPH